MEQGEIFPDAGRPVLARAECGPDGLSIKIWIVT